MQIIPNFEERNECPICSNKKLNYVFNSLINENDIKSIKNIYKEPSNRTINSFKNKEIALCKCNECNFIFHNYIPDSNTLNIIYTKLINPNISFEKYKKTKSLKKQKAKKLLERLKSSIKINQSKKINYLDFGFGWGYMLEESLNIGLKPCGIEYDKLKKNLISKKHIQAFTSLDELGSVENDKDRFSIITINQVLEHLKDPKETLERLRKISSKTSILYISVPKYFYKKKLSKSDIFKKGPLQPFEHLNCFSRKSIKKLAQKTSWELLGFKSTILNLFIISSSFNIFIILLLIIHSKFRKGTYYLIPKI